MSKVGILGSGAVGQTLAKGFQAKGYDVMMGTRDASKLAEFVSQNQGIQTGSVTQAAQFSSLIVLATKGHVALDVLKAAGSLDGKTIIDVTNPIDDSKKPDNGVLHYYTSLEESQLERLQKAFPNAHFVKAFNSIGNAFMVNPPFSEKPTMFICGNDDIAKQQVTQIVESFGFDVEDMGKMEAARAIEPLCILWCIPGFLNNEWTHAFKLLKK